MKFPITILGAAAAAFLSFAAFAEPIPLPGGFIQLSDNDAEYLVNKDGSRCTVGGDCTVDVGDRLVGIFDINSIEGLNPATAAAFTPFNGNELTGIFDITVTSVSGGPGAFLFSFAPTGDLSTAGAAVEMYYDPNHDYTRLGCATVALCSATASDGSLWAAFGFGPGSFWFASASSNDISTIGSVTPPFVGGTYNAALDFLVNNTGYGFAPHLCSLPGVVSAMADVCASGELLGTIGADTPFDSFSNVDFTLQRVPEPASLALLGLGLALLGVTRRKFS